jgi:hypothetical protein
MKACEAIALPVLAEASHVVEVVRTEVEDGGPRVTCGRGGKDEGRRGEDGEQGEVRDAARGTGAGRRRRRPAYVVTNTAA